MLIFKGLWTLDFIDIYAIIRTREFRLLHNKVHRPQKRERRINHEKTHLRCCYHRHNGELQRPARGENPRDGVGEIPCPVDAVEPPRGSYVSALITRGVFYLKYKNQLLFLPRLQHPRHTIRTMFARFAARRNFWRVQ